MMEEWKILPYALNYDVSNLGRVKQNKKNKLLKPYINKNNGYVYVFIRDNNGKYFNKRIHRLVAEMFIPNPNNLPMVNHKDFNRTNNNLDNLEWINGTQNNLWSRENIRKSAIGKKQTNQMRAKCSQRQISKSTNPYPTYIYKTKTGYIFRIVRYRKSVISKQKPTLEETIAYKENWMKEHKKEIEL